MSPPSPPGSVSRTRQRDKVGAMKIESEILISIDPYGRAEWRVEYRDGQGVCYVTIFAGPAAERRARDYGDALRTGVLTPVHAASADRCADKRPEGAL